MRRLYFGTHIQVFNIFGRKQWVNNGERSPRVQFETACWGLPDETLNESNVDHGQVEVSMVAFVKLQVSIMYLSRPSVPLIIIHNICIRLRQFEA